MQDKLRISFVCLFYGDQACKLEKTCFFAECIYFFLNSTFNSSKKLFEVRKKNFKD